MPDRRAVAPPTDSLVRLSASELARQIAAKQVTSLEAVEAYVRRIEEVNPLINAVVVPRFDDARREARAADEVTAAGRAVGPLHGVPFTIKECFHFPGLPSTIGLTNRVGLRDDAENPLVARLRAAGGILLGKTNIPQLMVWHECDNPVYGCTNLPHNLDRTPGGSTGGEAAAISAHCSPLGIGNDLGGSIRVPAAWCGLFGFKATSYRITNRGTTGAFRGVVVMVTQPGPLARSAEDCALVDRVLTAGTNDFDIAPVPRRDPAAVSIRGLKIAAWDDDGYFPACPTAKRAVREAAAALEQQGASVQWITPPRLSESIELYYSILGADGAEGAKQMSRGSQIDPRVGRMLWMAGLAPAVRWSIVQSLRWGGQEWQARLVSSARPCSAAQFWRLCDQLGDVIATFQREVFLERGVQALLSPPHALPALPHGTGFDLLPAASYAYHANLLGLPAGVVPWTTVRADETRSSAAARDITQRRAEETLIGAEGLPIGVQIAAPAWRDDVVLAVMQALDVARPTVS